MPRPRTVRYVGLVGSLLLAVAAFRGGSKLTRGRNLSIPSILRGEHGVVMPLCWLVGTALLIGAWWLGRRVVPSTRWALLTAVLWWLPLLPFLPMGSEDIYSYACQGWAQFAGHDPYAAGPLSLGCPWVDAVSPVWRNTPAPYGPVFLLPAGLAAQLSGGSLVGMIAGLRVLAVLGVALLAWAVPVLARRAGADPARAAWLVLACPLIGVHLVSGAHNDALMVGLLAAGLAVVAARPVDRGRAAEWAVLAGGGALLGAAVGVKATALVVLPFAVLAAVPRRSPLRALAPAGAAIGAGALGALLVASLLAGRGLGWVQGLRSSGGTEQWTSPPTAVGMTLDYLGRVFGQRWHTVPATRAVGLLLLVAVLVGLWWWARGAGGLLGAGLALAAVVALSPIVFPWYLTWPLAVLAAVWTGPPGSLTRWLLVPCGCAAALILPDGYTLALATTFVGALAMTVLVVVLVVRFVRRPPVLSVDRHPPVPAGDSAS